MSPHAGAVVVGYDGSADSELALDWADELAVGQGRALHVLVSRGEPGVEADARARAAAAHARESVVDVVAEPAGPALVDASARAATVVVGARGHGVLSGVVLGSVSQHVTRGAACPVVVVRAPEHPDARRVVVGVDGSSGSRKALEFGFDHASRTEAAIAAVHGWRNPVRGPAGDGLVDEIRSAERLLAEALAGFADRYPDVQVAVEALPLPPQRVLTEASRSASLVVVGSHGRGPLSGLLLGSVSAAVLHHAACAVAVVR